VNPARKLAVLPMKDIQGAGAGSPREEETCQALVREDAVRAVAAKLVSPVAELLMVGRKVRERSAMCLEAQPLRLVEEYPLANLCRQRLLQRNLEAGLLLLKEEKS
jgi:hypothetical protein